MRNHVKNSALLFLVLFFLKSAKAQNTTIIDIPGAIAYSAYASDANGIRLTNHNISIRMTILHGSTIGTSDWVERHQVTTDASSYFRVNVGEGQRTGGDYATFIDVDWNGPHFLKIEMDITGGNNFSFSTTEEFTSVPFAFHASVADSLGGINTDSIKLAIQSALNPATFALHSGVADSLGGVITDSLKRVVSAVLNAINFNLGGGCNCSLQNAYDNGTTIQNGVNGTSGPVIIDNSLYGAQALWVKSNGFGGYPALFENLNPVSNFNAVNIINNGTRYGLYVNNSNTTVNSIKHHTILTQNQSIAGSGLISQITNINNFSPSIASYTNGTSYAGYFTTSNPNTTAFAVRSEITTASQTLHGGVGEFYIFKANNDADAFRVQTNGIGRCISVSSTNSSTVQPAVDIQNTGGGECIRAWQQGTSGGAATFLTTAAGNPSLAVTKRNTNGLVAFFDKPSLTGTGAAVIINSNTNNGDGTYVITNSTLTTGFPITFQALTRGTGVTGYFRNNSLIANSFPLLRAEQNSLGIGLLLMGGHSPNSNNLLHVQNAGIGRSAFINGFNPNNTLPVTEITGTTAGNLLNVNLGGNGNVFNPLVAINNNTTNVRTVMSIENQASSVGLIVRNTNSTNNQNIAFVAANFSNFFTSEAARIEGNNGVGLNVRALGNDAILADAVAGSTHNAITASKSANDPGYAGWFLGQVRGSGFFLFNGTKSTVIKDNSGNQKLLYCEESPEVWFTDYGSGQLVAGHVIIQLDPTFVNASVTSQAYHVFVQLEDDCGNGVKVINKGVNSFEVVQMGSPSNCNASFSYRISAKRKYFENLRFASEAATKTANVNMINAVWPEDLARVIEIRSQGNATGQGLSVAPALPTPPEVMPTLNVPQEITLPEVALPQAIPPASPGNLQFNEEDPH